MLGKNNGQIDIFSSMIFERLVPKDHLLVKINSIIDFSFVYEKVKDKYSSKGRESKDPVMMLKICLLEYLYNLSDPQVVRRIRTDMAFRWFLGLSIDDEVPDDTTISHFRTTRMGEESFDQFFNEIVKKCIEKDLVKTKRFIIDTTDVTANVNYPSEKRLLCNAFRRVVKEIREFNEELADKEQSKFEEQLGQEHKSIKEYLKIAQDHAEYIYLKTYDELQTNPNYQEAFGILWDIIDQYTNGKKDKIVSVVDKDVRVAHKSPGNIKRGYKDHIMIDEESEIIISSVQTPFNVGDEKKLIELLDKADENLGLVPKEVTADKVYGTIDNRAYLKDKEIICNIDFYDESNREYDCFTIKEFVISEDLKSASCPSGAVTRDYILTKDTANNRNKIVFKFDKKICHKCPLKELCIRKNKNGKLYGGGRRVEISVRHDAILRDKKHAETSEFKDALNKRYKIERRFATMVRNHGLRRCRYLKLFRARIHMTLANMACNIVRMVNLLCPPILVVSKN